MTLGSLRGKVKLSGGMQAPSLPPSLPSFLPTCIEVGDGGPPPVRMYCKREGWSSLCSPPRRITTLREGGREGGREGRMRGKVGKGGRGGG